MGTDVEIAVVMGHHHYVRMGLITAEALARTGKLVYDNECRGNGFRIVYFREL